MEYKNKIIIDITPIGKPRMTRRDKWAKRDCVIRYFEYKERLNVALKGNFGVNSLFMPHQITFYLPMPKSWSIKKKKELEGAPHRSKPDIDNLLKAIYDSLLDDDSSVYYVTAVKYWDEEGKIIIEW